MTTDIENFILAETARFHNNVNKSYHIVWHSKLSQIQKSHTVLKLMYLSQTQCLLEKSEIWNSTLSLKRRNCHFSVMVSLTLLWLIAANFLLGNSWVRYRWCGTHEIPSKASVTYSVKNWIWYDCQKDYENCWA